MGFFSPEKLQPLLREANRKGFLAEEMDYDEVTGDMYVRHSQDVEPLLDELADFRVHGIDAPRKSAYRFIGEVPNVVLEIWSKEIGSNILDRDNLPELKRRLNDPQYRHLRVDSWRV